MGRLLSVAGLCGLLWGLGTAAAIGQEGFINREAEIQAAYLFNFGKYVTWPEDHGFGKEFMIGFIGESAIQEPLVRLARTKTLNGQTIVIQQFRTVDDYRPCQILFVPVGQNGDLAVEILRRARQLPTLIVGERRASSGSRHMISFFPEGNSLRFEIDPKSAEQARLKISSKLLSLGKVAGS